MSQCEGPIAESVSGSFAEYWGRGKETLGIMSYSQASPLVGGIVVTSQTHPSPISHLRIAEFTMASSSYIARVL